MRNIVLASKSPRRKELLKQIVEEFEIDVAVKPERKPFWVKKEKIAEHLAKQKAKEVFKKHPEAIVIGGGISNRKTFSAELKKELKKIMVPAFYDTVKLYNAAYANDGGIMGAYYNYLSVYR